MGKYTEIWKKKQVDTTNEEEGSSFKGGLPKLNWFNPNKAVKVTDKDGKPKNSCKVRVLPLESGEGWYVEFKKHSFKVGGTWKNCMCLESIGSGKLLGDCEICEFLSNNKEKFEETENENVKQLRPKDAYGILVYNFAEKEIQRLELNHYGFMDILRFIMEACENDEEFEEYIDKEGFTLLYTKDENGWAKISGVSKPNKTIDDIKEALGIENLPDLVAYTFPENTNGIKKILKSLVDLTINAGFFPEVSGGKSLSHKKNVISDDEDIMPKRRSTPKEEDDDLGIDLDIDLGFDTDDINLDEEIKEETKPSKKDAKKPSKTTIVDLDDDDDDGKQVKKPESKTGKNSKNKTKETEVEDDYDIEALLRDNDIED